MRTNPYVLGALLVFAGCSAQIGGEDPPGETGGVSGSTGGSRTGGSTSTGGSSNTGGISTPTGGARTGGFQATGGGTPTGGFGTGGSSTGGSATGGRATGGLATGGSGPATGGVVGPGGRATGGRAMGGAPNPGTGGSPSGTGGGSGVPTSNCTDADKTVTSNQVSKHCNYTYEYWKDSGGSGTMTLTKDGFNLQWSGINDILGRKGLRPGNGSVVVDYSADFQPNGNSYLTIYGWTRNPLVEYYIVDSWGNWRPPGGQGHVGTVESDGGTYDIYKISKTGANIDGNGAFTQYWSVRTAKKTSGTITTANHFAAWKNNGMPMGSFYEVSMTVEGYQSSGTANVKFSMK